METVKTPTLVVLAAGMGSRYGGIKQMDPVGPDGEFILDYSVYDAWRAGFRRVVFIVREDIEEALRGHFAGRLDGRIEADYAVQRLTDLPTGYECPSGRAKPWGTGHAIWCARHAVKGPFAAINADDFYGRRSFEELAAFLNGPELTDSSCALVAFRLANTLSENGSVSRGICTGDADGMLADIVERTSIEPDGAGARFKDERGEWQPLTGEEPASMNLWAFPDTLFPKLEALLKEFLDAHIGEPKSEFYIPTVVNTLLQRREWRVYLRRSPEKWFGMTYSADRAMVLERLAELTRIGEYPAGLWR